MVYPWRAFQLKSHSPSTLQFPFIAISSSSKVAPYQKLQQLSTSLFILPLKPPSELIYLCVSQSRHRSRSSFSDSLRSNRAASPQKVYPPWASPKGAQEIPPSYVWQDATKSPQPLVSSSFPSRIFRISATTKLQ